MVKICQYKKSIYIDEEKNKDFYMLEVGNHLITNNAPFKKGKTIVSKRVKIKTLRLPLTVIKNYYCGVIQINADADLYQFKKDEKYLISPKDCKKVNDEEWHKAIHEINLANNSYGENLKKINKKKIRNQNIERDIERIVMMNIDI